MKLSIDLTQEEYDALKEVARYDRRSMRDEAAWIITLDLRKRGFLSSVEPRGQREG